MPYKPIYWMVLTPFIKSYLKKHCTKVEIKQIMRRAKREYKDLLAKADDIGSNNPMVSNLYFSLLFLAFHLANKAQISKDQLKELMTATLNHPVLRFFIKADFNNDRVMDKMNRRMRKNAKWAEENKDKYPETWEFNFYQEPRVGCAYYFTKCPIAKFFKDNKLEDYTKLFCDLDYINIEARKGRLIRKHTLAEGAESCDFWILGNKAQVDLEKDKL